MALGPAQRLDDVYLTISPKPLMDDAEFEAFYVGDVNAVRGRDRIKQLAQKLQRAQGKSFEKAFLVGHSGVGKSTELTRLLRAEAVSSRYEVIRFSATDEFNPVGLDPFDVVLLMMDEMVKATRKLVGAEADGELEQVLKDVWVWFGKKETESLLSEQVTAGASVGAGVDPSSLMGKVIQVFAKVRGEMQYAYERTTRTVDYSQRRIADLVDLCNRLISMSNRILRMHYGKGKEKEWLFIGEDFDKPHIPVARVKDLFINHAILFKRLESHFIFTLPIELCYSELAAKLPLGQDQICNLHDIPVFQRDHTPNEAGRDAVKALLAARVDLSLFADDALDVLVTASGGNLRDLFSIVALATDYALLDEAPQVALKVAEEAVNELRTGYRNRLGTGMEAETAIPYEEKADLLVRVYKGEQKADIPERAMFQLLRARAIQEFNGKRWFGVHPMVVDLLRRQGYDLDA